MERFRTRFKKDIVAEMLLPTRRGKHGDKIVILCEGMPTASSKRGVMEFFARKGYVTIHPKYRGSWESQGSFLKKSPVKDVEDVLDSLSKPIPNFFTGKNVLLKPLSIYLVAGSFGGPAGILLSQDERVNKVIAISPVVDWTSASKAEPLDWLYGFVKDAFGEGYRFTKSDWNKLSTGTFYNPMRQIDTVDGKKLFIVHTKDDESVRYQSVVRFAKKTGSTLKLYKRGGHLSFTFLMKPSLWRQIEKFLKE